MSLLLSRRRGEGGELTKGGNLHVQTDGQTDGRERRSLSSFFHVPPFFPDAFKNSRRGLVRLPVFFHRAIVNPFSRSFRFLRGLEKEKEEEETANYSSVSSLSSSPLPLFEMFLFCASCLVGKLGKRPVAGGFKRRRREKRRSLARLLSFYSCIYTCMKFTQERMHRRKPLPEMTFRNSLIATEFPRLGDDCPKKSQNR